jgi:hypothetical protein
VRQPTLIIIEKVTARTTRTIGLNVLLGGGTNGVGMGVDGVDVDGSESLLFFDGASSLD